MLGQGTRLVERILQAAILIGVLLASCPSRSETPLAFPVHVRLSGIDVRFPVEVILTDAVVSGGQPAFVARINLDEFIAKVDAIIVAAGLDAPPGDYQSFNYNGTILRVSGDRIWAKYHFRIDLRGAKPTNGSLELFFRPAIADNAVRLAAEDPKLNVSNDLARGMVQTLGIDRRLLEKGMGDITRLLAEPDARLQLPPILTAASAQLASARFQSVGGHQILVIEGVLGKR